MSHIRSILVKLCLWFLTSAFFVLLFHSGSGSPSPTQTFPASSTLRATTPILKEKQLFNYKITKRLKSRSFPTFRWLVCSNLCNNGCLLVCGSGISYRERLFSTAGDLIVITIWGVSPISHHPLHQLHFLLRSSPAHSTSVLIFPINNI